MSLLLTLNIFTSCFSIFIVNFEQMNADRVVTALLLNIIFTYLNLRLVIENTLAV